MGDWISMRCCSREVAEGIKLGEGTGGATAGAVAKVKGAGSEAEDARQLQETNQPNSDLRHAQCMS